ncbi:MAG TPA: mechanosensitive ion channel [Oscillatoriales cyanobacterium M59_W2019_021]|nr:mechanosensitive ion channel [Oscillatoriales cyanobacterium M4454_W2019_049]HIK51113.1 mechanosensitive ion channel [Oscillatoriales cyanobacterium M59_W2019_021]
MNFHRWIDFPLSVYRLAYQSGIPNYLVFLIFALCSVFVGQFTPRIARWFIGRFGSSAVLKTYDKLTEPIQYPFRVAGILVLISISSVWLKTYDRFYDFIKPFLDLAVIFSVAWLVSRLFRQIVRLYGIDLLKKAGLEVDELLLVFETIVNVGIGFIAVLAYAQSQRLNLLGLFAGLGLGGLAIAAAAQKILEQLLSTIVLYLDRPFKPGEYIRLQKSQQIPEGIFGRVESIGLRSTKIRTSGISTLFIVPNSTLVNLEIENLTRGKKVMAMIYLDFVQKLEEEDRALVRQAIVESTDSVFGIDPGSTNITFNQKPDSETTQARITFFILGSSENSLQLRKRLLELANQTLAKKLDRFGIEFMSKDPTVYVESPITM